ncbi:MAG: deoxyribose-phosphate aldolase, partial [Bacteroidaceae bacterium]|nr:deoxyribose-phosphate aldolase [Bacteroidaceae bacterium]
MSHHHDHECECGCEHEHNHFYEEDFSSRDKYNEALAQYNTRLNDEQIRSQVSRLLEYVNENNTPEVKKKLLSSIDLTTLKTTDNEESVLKLVERVNEFDELHPDLPHVAAICVYPCF